MNNQLQAYTFGELLCSFRNREGFTQEELAKELGCGRKTIIRWENSEHLPGRYADRIPRLKDALSLSDEEYQNLQTAASSKISRSASHQSVSNQTSIYDHFPMPAKAYHVPRPGAISALAEKVFTAHEAGHWVALVGLAGQGKTTLLAEFVRDPDVRATFAPSMAGYTSPQTSRLSPEMLAKLLKTLPAFDLPKPPTLPALHAALRSYTQNQSPVLLVIDNLGGLGDWQDSRDLPFHDIPGVTVLLSVQRANIAEKLGIAPEWHVDLPPMTQEEGLKLIAKLYGDEPLPKEEREAAKRVVQFCNHQPLALRAMSQFARNRGWRETYSLLQRGNPQERATISRTVNDNADRYLEMSWQELPPHLQSAARKLGTAPLFSTFDQYVGAALWRTSPAKAEDIWSELVDWQLAHAPRPGCYQLHSQVHAFFEAKASGSLEHVLTWNWIWRYRLQEAWPGWRFWRLSVPPSPASFWEHVRWSGQLPGTASNFKFGSLVQALIKRYWATDWSLKISPLTWVVVKRLSVIMYSGSLLGLAFIASQLWWPSAPVLLHLVFFIVGFGLGLWGFWRGEDRMRIFDWELQGSSFEEILTDTNAYTVST